MKYKVLSNIPIPRYKNGGAKRGNIKGPNSNPRYPWLEMEIGDAICVGPYDPKKMTNILTLANHSWPAKYYEWKYAARTIDNQIYVFRIQ